MTALLVALGITGYAIGGIWGVSFTWRLMHSEENADHVQKLRAIVGRAFTPHMLSFSFLFWFVIPLILWLDRR